MTLRYPANIDVTLEDALDTDVWQTVNRRLLSKMLAEFAYEEVVEPEPIGSPLKIGERGMFRVDLGEAVYRFEAAPRMLDSYHIYDASIERRDDDGWASATDAIRFFRDLEAESDVDGVTAGHLVEELNNTLLADAHIEARKRKRDGGLPADADYTRLESEMEGHPWITYNKGRVGFDYDDYCQFAPESQQPVSLEWAAVSRERATFTTVDGLDPESLLRGELGEHYDRFRDDLRERGLNPADYYLAPIHEWQWTDSIVQLFPRDIATDDVVPLGNGPDKYFPQQSIRTLTNIDDPEKHHVKVPLHVLNTLVYRGLPGKKITRTPRITEGLQAVRDEDPFFADECDLVLLGEVAGLHYPHRDFEAIDGAPYQYRELFGSVWRESVYRKASDDERPVTLAALLHVDGEDVPFVSRLIEESGLNDGAWVEELFDTLWPPLLHFLYRYGAAFSPHGQDVILLLEDGVPTRLALKDLIDVNVSEERVPELAAVLDSDVHEAMDTKDDKGLAQVIFASLVVCVLRYLADVLATYRDYPEKRFWSQARAAIEAYQDRFPELAERFDRFDLLAPEFPKLCLNRNRLLAYGYADDGERPDIAVHGTVRNPLQ
ncbi:IucA/IucC family protein [Haloprofundus halobius]|uniref:IucA/IucC family protein n=1 Tax=Haloprofundus halobius TaxID=2876194 RepID=UPI001CCF9BBA|nr:IucA/IucC family siderophore biosynthesis protein [Haloprofundus halobius]